MPRGAGPAAGRDPVREAKAGMNYLRYLHVTGSRLIYASAHGMTLTIPAKVTPRP